MSLLPAASFSVWDVVTILNSRLRSVFFAFKAVPKKQLARLCVVGSALIFASCTSLRVATGQRVRLSETQVFPPLSAGLADNVGIAPGGQAAMIATLQGPHGETLVTEGAGHGKIMWRDLHVACSVVGTDSRGNLFLPEDPRISDGRTPHVVVTVPNHPDLRAEFDLPIMYNRDFVANFSGSPGFSGRDGCNGQDGANGSPGSTEPNNPSPGGNGSNGANGTDGENGQPGGDAPGVIVKATLRSGGYRLLQIVVSGGGQDRYFLVDPNAGSLTIYADGGLGGAGGRGGRGGTGGAGGVGRPNGRNGANGANGHDGFSAPAGNGGAITVIYDETAQPYLGAIHFSSRNGPAPVFKQEPVPPLW